MKNAFIAIIVAAMLLFVPMGVAAKAAGAVAAPALGHIQAISTGVIDGHERSGTIDTASMKLIIEQTGTDPASSAITDSKDRKPIREGTRGLASQGPATRKEVARKGGLGVSREKQHQPEIGRKGVSHREIEVKK